MKRQVKPIACQLQALDTTGFVGDPIGWFRDQPSVGDPSWFLAHADDGVIWGQVRRGELVTSRHVFPQVSPPLQPVTLQQARLFGDKAEVRIWREEGCFRACRLEDLEDQGTDAFHEEHILWGTQAEEQREGFTLLVEGRQGLRHAVPMDVGVSSGGKKGYAHAVFLVLRHYIAYDSDGHAHIFLSRLLGLRQRLGG